MNDTVYGRLRKFAAELTVPPGLEYPEISHGEIVMMMSPVKRHELAALRLRRQLDAQLPDAVSRGDQGVRPRSALRCLARGPRFAAWASQPRATRAGRSSGRLRRPAPHLTYLRLALTHLDVHSVMYGLTQWMEAVYGLSTEQAA
ncbi:hypothetical protein [Streptomyces sp. NPDC048445]|uniref:hypothetical protein n=1 Tax=Streptomyces sp. NPDC048445 TaxID=3365553 RepID=UPI0037242308